MYKFKVYENNFFGKKIYELLDVDNVTKGLYSKIVKIFGGKKYEKSLFFFQNLPVFEKIELCVQH